MSPRHRGNKSHVVLQLHETVVRQVIDKLVEGGGQTDGYFPGGLVELETELHRGQISDLDLTSTEG